MESKFVTEMDFQGGWQVCSYRKPVLTCTGTSEGENFKLKVYVVLFRILFRPKAIARFPE